MIVWIPWRNCWTKAITTTMGTCCHITRPGCSSSAPAVSAKPMAPKNWLSVTGLKNAGNSSICDAPRKNRRTKAHGLRILRNNTRIWSSECPAIRRNATGWTIETPPPTSMVRHVRHGISWDISSPSAKPDKSSRSLPQSTDHHLR